MPISSVACESRRLQAEHGTNGALADPSDEVSKPRAICSPAGGAPQVFVNHGNVCKAVAASKVHEFVLPSLAFEVFVNLNTGGLAHVHDGLPREQLPR